MDRGVSSDEINERNEGSEFSIVKYMQKYELMMELIKICKEFRQIKDQHLTKKEQEVNHFRKLINTLSYKN